jgi:hypothetical protein
MPYIHDRGTLPTYTVMTFFQYISKLIANRLNQSSEKTRRLFPKPSRQFEGARLRESQKVYWGNARSDR